MKNVKEAVKYGIETLGVTPEEMFALIESSRDYSGDDYKRWLANEIIKIAEREEVGFSQLLVKKFSIIQSLAEDADTQIKPNWLEYLKSKLPEPLYSVDFSYLGNALEDIDWFNSLDYDEVNTFFTDENLPEEIGDKLRNHEELTILSRLSSDPSSKSSELFKSAKSRNIVCKNEGSLMLYRMCTLVDALNLDKNFKFAFFTSTDFLYDSDNADIIKFFLTYFNYKGFVVKSTELFTDTFVSSNFAFVVCTPRGLEDKIQDGFILDEICLEGDKEVSLSNKRYSRSSKSLRSFILDKCKVFHNGSNNIFKGIDRVETKGVLSNAVQEDSNVLGLSGALGYLNFDIANHCWLTSLPDLSAKTYYPIYRGNLNEVIVFYGVVKSLAEFGMPTDIHKIITGSSEYMKLLSNCLIIFLFDIHSNFSTYKGFPNAFDIVSSDLVGHLLEKSEVYFSFEAKELLDICKGFLDYLKQEGIEDTTGMTFEEIRKSAKNSDLDEAYLIALKNLKDYVRALYKEVE